MNAEADRRAAKARNKAARERARHDPEAVANAAMRSATLPETLGLGEGIETRDGTTYVKIRTDLTEAEAKRAEIVRDVAGNLWLRSRLTDRPGLTGFDSRANGEAICDGLGKLPSPHNEGLSLLTLAVEALPGPLDARHLIAITDRRGDGRNLHRVPALADLATLSPVEAVLVDGEPMVSAGPHALTTWRRVRPKPGEQRTLFAGPRSLGGLEVGDIVIRTLASLPRMDMRSPIVGDVARTAALAFAFTGYGPIPDSAGAVFVGGRDTLANRQRWWKACEWLRHMTITINPQTGEWVGLANVDPDGAGGVHLGPPAWWRGRGEGQRWRLSGALWRPVRIGSAGRGAGGQDEHYAGLARMLAGFEARLCYSPTAGRGKRGRVPDALRPVRKGGPGPEVWIGWRDALTLAGENVPNAVDVTGTEGRRYRKRVDALIAAGYRVGALGEAAPAGDTVEIVRVQRGARNRPAGLRVRASARFCAAVGGRQTWERVPAMRLLGTL